MAVSYQPRRTWRWPTAKKKVDEKEGGVTRVSVWWCHSVYILPIVFPASLHPCCLLVHYSPSLKLLLHCGGRTNVRLNHFLLPCGACPYVRYCLSIIVRLKLKSWKIGHYGSVLSAKKNVEMAHAPKKVDEKEGGVTSVSRVSVWWCHSVYIYIANRLPCIPAACYYIIPLRWNCS